MFILLQIYLLIFILIPQEKFKDKSPYSLIEMLWHNLGTKEQTLPNRCHVAASNDISASDPVLSASDSLSMVGKRPGEKGRAQHDSAPSALFPCLGWRERRVWACLAPVLKDIPRPVSLLVL